MKIIKGLCFIYGFVSSSFLRFHDKVVHPFCSNKLLGLHFPTFITLQTTLNRVVE